MRTALTASTAAPAHAPRPAVLCQLRLSADDLACVARQGFVAAEVRGPGRTCFKLRFRNAAGRQRVRYLGNRPEHAARVAEAVKRLQAGRRADLHLKRSLRRARTALRAAKTRLAPLLSAAGLAFHGYAIRRPRRRAKQTWRIRHSLQHHASVTPAGSGDLLERL